MHRRFFTACVVAILALPVGRGVLAQTQFITQPATEPQMDGPVILQSLDLNELVKGVPYSADAMTEIVQPLADGNRIVRQTTASIFRDARGRVRREQTLAAIGPMIVADNQRTVTISDPEAGISYELQPASRLAIRHRLPHLSTAGATPAGAGTAVVRTFGRKDTGPSGFVTTSSGALPNAPTVKTESLGRRVIEGITADGSRTTVTTPPGAIGNERALETTSERWFSQDLRIVVLSHSFDPRFGETTYQLTRITRNEPGSELFEVPAGYRVVNDPGLPR